MAKTRYIQNNFLSGELSPLLYGNITLQQYYQGAKEARNVFIVPQGGLKRRAGLAYGATALKTQQRYTATLPTMPNGGTPANINDNNTGTSTSTTTPVGTTDPYVVAQYDLGVDAPKHTKVLLRDISISVGSYGFFYLQSSNDAASWSTFYGPFSLNTTAKDIDAYGDYDASGRYLRLVKTGATDLGAAVVSLSEFNVFTDTGSMSEAKLVPISTELGYDYCGMITEGVMRIYKVKNGVLTLIDGVSVPYLSSEVKDVRSASIGDVTLLFHENHPPQRLINYGDSDEPGFTGSKNPFGISLWYIDEAPFSNIPLFDFNDSLSPTPVAEQQDVTFASFSKGMRYQIDVKGVLSKNISYAGDANPNEQASTEENLRKNLQDMPVFGDTGISVNRVGANQYRITIENESADAYELFSGFNTTGSTSATMTFTKVATGSPRREAIWSSNRGYPRLGSFFQGRLWIGGTRDKSETLLASKSGDYLNFDTGGGEDDEGIFYTLTSRRSSEIRDIYSGRDLLIFTAGSEYAAVDATITPATLNLRLQSSNGSLFIQAQESDGAVVYADQNGKTIRESAYTFNEDAYGSQDISVLSSHLIKTPVSMGFLTGTASEDSNWLFIVNADGSAAVLNKLRSQDINGFTSMDTNGDILESSVFGDNAAFIVKRSINGNDVIFLELLSFSNRMDCSINKNVASSSISGYEHLNGETVSVRVNNAVLPSRVVSGGVISLTSEEFAQFDSNDILEAGYNFDVSIQTMPVNTNIGSGENFMRLKKIVRMNLRVNQTTGIYIDGVEIPARSFGDGAFGELDEYTGILSDVYPTEGWNRDIVPIITCPDPTPVHIQAIEYEVESS